MVTITLNGIKDDGERGGVEFELATDSNGDPAINTVSEILNTTKYGDEVYEIVPVGTVGAASIVSPVWLSTKNLTGGMIYAKGDSITSATAWSLNAHYSFDGVNEVTSEAIDSDATAAVATGAVTLSVNFGESVDTADALGFAKKIKQYPYVKFSMTFTGGTAAGTAESKAVVSRYYE